MLMTCGAWMLAVLFLEIPGHGSSTRVASLLSTIARGDEWNATGGPHRFVIPGRQGSQLLPPLGSLSRIHPARSQDKERYQSHILTNIHKFLNLSNAPMPLDGSSSINSETEHKESKKHLAAEQQNKNHKRRMNSKSEDRKTRIISIGEKVFNSSDKRAVQFALNQTKRIEGPLHVTRANVVVLVRLNQTSDHRGKSPTHRLTIKVFILNSTLKANSKEAAAPIAYLNISPRHTRWERILLPTSIVQIALDSDDQLLCLLITCDACKYGDEVVTFSERKSTARRPNAPDVLKQKSGIGKKPDGVADGEQPYLIIHAKTKQKQPDDKSRRHSGCKELQRKGTAC